MLTEADIRRSLPNLRNYAYALTSRGAGAEDLVQDTLTRAWSRRAYYCGGDARAWLLAIMHNEHINQARRVTRHGKMIASHEYTQALYSAPQQIARVELRELEDAMRLLTQEQRTTVLLAGLTRADYNDIALALDVPVGTIRSRLARGRETLRKLTGTPQSSTRSPDRRRQPHAPERPVRSRSPNQFRRSMIVIATKARDTTLDLTSVNASSLVLSLDGRQLKSCSRKALASL